MEAYQEKTEAIIEQPRINICSSESQPEKMEAAINVIRSELEEITRNKWKMSHCL
jgi:hypothetical protein